MSLEPEALGRDSSAEVDLATSRTPAMTVVLERWRRVEVKPLPMPRLAPVMRYVRDEDMVALRMSW